jgi:hypothetical protein
MCVSQISGPRSKRAPPPPRNAPRRIAVFCLPTNGPTEAGSSAEMRPSGVPWRLWKWESAVRVFRQISAFVPGLLPSCNRCPTYLFRRSQGLGAVVGCATDGSKPATTKDGTPQRCVALPRFRKTPASCRSLRPCSLCGFLSGEPQQRALCNALRRRPVLVRGWRW